MKLTSACICLFMMNSIIGSSVWQHNLEYQQAMASTDDEHDTWRNAAARLNSGSHDLRNESMDKNADDYYYRKFYFNDMPLRNLSVKMHPATDHQKWYKTLPPGEMLPRNEVLGGYIFVCNNETMQEDLRRQLFGNFKNCVCSQQKNVVCKYVRFFHRNFYCRASTEVQGLCKGNNARIASFSL